MKSIICFASLENFSTQRLSALKIEENDLDKFLMMDINPDVMKTLGGVKSSKETLERLRWNLNQWKNNGFGLWMFYRNDTNEWVGRGGLRRIEVEGVEEIEVAEEFFLKKYIRDLFGSDKPLTIPFFE